MNKRFWLYGLLATPMMLCQGAGEGAPAGAAPPVDGSAPAATPAAVPPETPAPAGDATPKTPWYKGSEYDADTQAWLAARGLTEDDPSKVLPKLVKGHRSAEQRLGKGVDAIMDRPAKDQPYAEWARANAKTLGLPEAEADYTIKQPEFWPKEAKWDTDMEAASRKLAFEHGVSPSAHQAFVDLFAQKVKSLDDLSASESETAKAKMMADLEKDFGDQTPAKIAQARQAAQAIAEKAGLDSEGLERVGQLLAKGTGDAQTIRFMAAIGEMMGEDSAVALGKGGSLTMTPADARAEFVRFNGPEGEYGKAFAAGDNAKLRELAGRRAELAKLASR